jgi:ABC-type glycerol-3-phosphate transport system permease component
MTMRKSLASKVILPIFMILVLVWIFFPVYFMFISAFKNNTEIFSYPPNLLFNPSIQGFMDALYAPASGQTGRAWGLHFMNSALLSTTSTAIALLLGVPVAFALSHLKIKNKERTAFSFLTIRMLPAVAILLPLYLMLYRIGLLATHLGLIMVYVIFGLPWIVWLMRSFLDSIPHEVYEAAQVDGASNPRILLTVLLPAVKAGLLVSAVFSILEAWNDFVVAFIIGGASTMTVPVALGTLLSERLALWNTIFAVGVLNCIPALIIMVVMRKYWARALTLGLVG